MARGTLRIYLGAAPGVGKTFAMLNEGRRAQERGTDVLVGYVETHGRAHTAEQIGGLEVVPRKVMEYRGATFEEMDLDAILARHPDRVLVDELAHTNVPGSRNEKRWQDIDDLLNAGINVISTVNIQHLESLNDVVENITGIQQRETVPDGWVRGADQIELVDMTPEALRRRMAHGNIYKSDKIDAALGNYFRVGNLAALRELALLWLADRVEESLDAYRERHGITGPWETKERVVVALTGAPSGDDLIRRAARMASRSRGELLGVHVQSDDGLSGPTGGALDRQRRLLEELGGRYHEVVGGDVARALVQFAKAENATQLVMGASRRSRWAELTRGSVITPVVREAAGALDVHVISTEGATEGVSLRTPAWFRLAPLSRGRQFTGFLLAIVGLPVLTFVLSQFRSHLGFQNVLLIFLLFVVATTTIGGIWPGILASVGGFLLLNWFFAPPIHTFTIGNTRDLLALIAFLVIAGVISALVNQVERRAADAARASARANALGHMTGTVLENADPLPELAAELVSAFRLEGASVLVGSDGEGWHTMTAAGEHPPDAPEEGSLTLPLSDDASLVLSGGELRAEDREVLRAFANQLAVALAGRRLQAEAATATALAKANELRTALLAAVSHDLRTPLASIKASATSLLSNDVTWDPAAERDLLKTIDIEADRLNSLVGNLLDMSRLQTGSLPISPRPVGLEEVVAGAVSSLGASDAAVETDVPETLPLIDVDPALLERAVANLVENAIRHAPAGKPVRVIAGQVGDGVDLRVIDTGPGIPHEEWDRVFRPFQRLGDNPNGAGVGLGLAVAKGFVEAVGGELTVEDTPGGGTTMVVALPIDAS
ncbi:MAG: sensor histidine kinase KdpD [Acidimicrobiia bacterium]|nr:sensor histidine kinase KdpD [Acidimicrobiia bacterium]